MRIRESGGGGIKREIGGRRLGGVPDQKRKEVSFLEEATKFGELRIPINNKRLEK